MNKIQDVELYYECENLSLEENRRIPIAIFDANGWKKIGEVSHIKKSEFRIIGDLEFYADKIDFSTYPVLDCEEGKIIALKFLKKIQLLDRNFNQSKNELKKVNNYPFIITN